MKKSFLVVLLATFLLALAIPASADLLTLTPTGTPGRYDVSINRPTGKVVGGFDINILFDPLQSTFTVSFDSLLGNPDPMSFETFFDVSVVGLGEAKVVELSFLDEAVLEGMQTGPKVHLFDFIVDGSAPTIGSYLISDGFGNPIVEGATIPEPASMALMLAGLGICGLGLRRR